MKNAVFIVIVIVLLGWTTYELIVTSKEKEAREYGSAMSDEIYNSGDASDFSNSGIRKGELAPDFELTTIDGEKVRLSDYRGTRVMLNFWATWCPPCRAEMPDMQRFHEDTDIVILAVNLTETKAERENIDPFVDEFGLTFPILLDENLDAATLYRIQPIPTTYLINSDGTIHNMAFGALNYELMVQEFQKMN